MTMEDLKTKQESKVQRPKQYGVVFLNDDFTTMDFVTETIVRFLGKSVEEANHLTLEIHGRGQALVGGPYTLEIAETKSYQCQHFAREREQPLMVKLKEL